MKFHTVLPPDEILQTGAGLSTQALRESLPIEPRGLRRSTSTARLVSHIRQLCVLGVDSHTLMPALVDVVSRLVHADYGTFWWAGEDYQHADVYLNAEALKSAAALSRYTATTTPEEFAQRTREAHGLDFATAMRRGYGWSNTAQHERTFLSSLEFELLWRPIHVRHGLEQTLVQNGRGWGSTRQAHICAHLTEGASYADTAKKIGVRPSSVIDQMRKMYTRLDVNDRPDLLQRLSAAALAPVGESV